MEPEGSLPHSQELATCPYPEPVQSSPCPPIPLREDPFQYYPPIYAWVSQLVAFPQVSPPKSCMHLSPPPYVLHTSKFLQTVIKTWHTHGVARWERTSASWAWVICGNSASTNMQHVFKYSYLY